jgi:uncharacterized protein
MPSYLSPGVYVEEVPPLARPIAGVSTSTPGFIGVIPDTVQIPAPTQNSDAAADKARGYKWVDFVLPPAAEVHFVTTWSQYTNLFGDFVGQSSSPGTSNGTPAITTGQNNLANAVYGFFNNGGTSCYVTRVATEGDLSKALGAFARIDGISMVAAPGLVSSADYSALITHCENLLDRVAILDPVQVDANSPSLFGEGDFSSLQNPVTVAGPPPGLRPTDSEYAAFYFPWITVQDPSNTFIANSQKSITWTPSKALAVGAYYIDPNGNVQQVTTAGTTGANPPATWATAHNGTSTDGTVTWTNLAPLPQANINIPPSGHLAGIYARTDSTRGVFKAPANEQVNGALDLRWRLGKADQDILNPPGVNLIRSLNGGILVWGARTVGGDDNGDFKYISTRRYFNYLRKSIEQGTQFVVFEPNSPALWQRILRSVGDFLLNEWRNGALFGDKPEQAFFVKCDNNTNTSVTIALGQVITEIGVAIVQPAEFVIFRIQQQAAS